MRPSIDQIITAVSQQTTIFKPDIIGRSRFPEHVAARKMLATVMMQYGYAPLEIANLLQKTRSMVYYYVNPQIRSRKSRYHQQVRKHARLQAQPILAIQSEQQFAGVNPRYWRDGGQNISCRAIDC